MRARVRNRAGVAAVAAAAATAAVLASTPLAAADRGGEPHLPNLVTRRPLGLRLWHQGDATLLRFSNTVVNAGDGPLELRPENVGETTTAYQRVLTPDGQGWVLVSEQPVGTFVFHPQHSHWHFEAFSEYQLRRVRPDGGIGRLLRETEDKVSFCVADSLSIFANLPHASPVGVYPTTCAQSAIQGLSVGWGDRYAWQLYGQWVDVTGIPTGRYWLTSSADPLDLIDETDETDNRSAVLLRLSADGVDRL